MNRSEADAIRTAIKHTFPKDKCHVNYIGHLFSKILLPRCPSIFENKEKEEWSGIYGYKLVMEEMSDFERRETLGFILSLAIENME